MNSEKLVLAAVDFSPCSEAAFREAKRVAGRLGASLSVIHVIAPAYQVEPNPTWPTGLAIALPTDRDRIARAHRRWSQFADKCGGANGARFSVEFGNPRDQLLEGVRRERPTMLMVGACAAEDAYRGIGTTAAACAQYAATPVMVVREGITGPFKSVVACIDFGDTSRRVLEQAIAIATEDGAALHILHVFEDPWHGAGPTDDIAKNMPEFADTYRKAIERQMQEFCEPVTHELGALKPTFHAIEAASHAEGISAFITARRCDLAVVGTRSKFKLREYFWGSTAERVVRDAKCSILAVKPPGFIEMQTYEPLADTAAIG